MCWQINRPNVLLSNYKYNYDQYTCFSYWFNKSETLLKNLLPLVFTQNDNCVICERNKNKETQYKGQMAWFEITFTRFWNWFSDFDGHQHAYLNYIIITINEFFPTRQLQLVYRSIFIKMHTLFEFCKMQYNLNITLFSKHTFNIK